MRKVLIVALFLLFAPFAARAQTAQGYLTASGTTCATAGACVTLNIPSQAATGTFTISGTWSATLQFEISQDGTNFAAVNAFPPNSSTGASSATANGTWTVSIAGMRTFRVRCSAFTSGSALVTINTSNAVSAAAMAAGGGGGTVTAVTGTSPVASSGGTTPAISCPTCFFGGPNTSGTIPVANGTQSLTDAVGVTYSFPGSVPTLTWTNGSATAVISPTSVVVSDGSGNSAGLFNSGVGSFSQVGGVSTTNIDGATVTQTDSSTGHSIDWDGSTASGQFTETAAPGGNPPSGSDFVYFNSTTHLFTCLTHTGGNCLPSGVTGPGSAVSGDIATFNGTSGAIIQDQGNFDNGHTTANTLTYSGSGGFTASAGPVTAGGAGGAGGSFTMPEGTAVSASSGNDICQGDSTLHGAKCSYNNGSFLNLPLETGTMTSGHFVSVNATTNLLQDSGTGITPFTATSFATTTNCAAVGTAASPSVASCGAAAAGQFSCATNASTATCTVNTTAVTANSEIFVLDSDTAVTGTRLGVTCNTSTAIDPTSRLLASSVAATSFTINLGTVTTNPACFSYYIVN